jgi:hypothetical protein
MSHYNTTGRAAGEEGSITNEGRYLTFLESDLTHPTHSDGFANKGDPVNIGNIVGVVSSSDATAATDLMTVDTEGLWYLNVVASDEVGTSAVADGDQLYINTGVISKKASGIPFGKAITTLSGSASSAVALVKVHADASHMDPSYIVVSTEGNDTYGNGSWDRPYATLTKAMTMVSATRKTIYMFPGDYAEAALITWPSINGVRLIGLDGNGNVVISNANAAAEVILMDPTVQTSSFEAFLENVCISHTAQIGLEINNTATAKKVIVQLKSVAFEAVSTGNSIHVTHTDAGNAIRIYGKDCNEIEGLVYFHVLNADDRIRFYQSVLIGGLQTSADSVAGEVTLIGTVVLTGGLTIGSATNVLAYVGSCYRTDAGVYTELTDTYST